MILLVVIVGPSYGTICPKIEECWLYWAVQTKDQPNPCHIGLPHGNHVKQYLCIFKKLFFSFTDDFFTVLKERLCYVFMLCYQLRVNLV